MIEYKPKIAIHPGAIVEDHLDYLGVSQKWLAEHTGLSEKHISEIINGEASITADTAVKLSNTLGGSVEFWNNLDANYRAAKARLDQEKSAKTEIPFLKRIPYNDMAKAGWVPKASNKLECIINLYSFFGISSLSDIRITQPAAFRKSYKQSTDPYAMAAWLRQGEVKSKQYLDIEDFDKDKLKNSLAQIRRITYQLPQDFFQQIRNILSECGVILVAVKYLPNTCVNGATRWIGRHPVIQLSDRGKSDDKVWFTLFHELGHVILHSKKEQFINLEKENITQQEAEADAFATEALLSHDKYQSFIDSCAGDFTEENILKLSSAEEIAPSIILGRLKHDGYLPWNKFNSLHKKIQVAE